MGSTTAQEQRAPWWTFGYVWLVIAGPAAVVLAGIATVWLAIANPETLVARNPERPATGQAFAPAMQGRNHAATGVPAGR